MASRSKSRLSLDSNTAPKVRQPQLPPEYRRTVSNFRSLHPRSKIQLEQSTLTQLGYITPIKAPDLSDLELDYVDADEMDSSRRPKRRKIVYGHPTPKYAARPLEDDKENEMVITKSTKGPTGVNRSKKIEYPTPVEKHKSPLKKTMMQVPETPHRPKPRIIPSSQSPDATPLSIRSVRSVRALSRSPLKERSTNLFAPLTSSMRSRKSPIKPPKPVIKSSVSQENATDYTQSFASRLEELPKEAEFTPQTQKSQSNEEEMVLHSVSPDLARSTSDKPIKTEIRDSDDETADDSDLDEEYPIGAETQAILSSSHHSPNDPTPRALFTQRPNPQASDHNTQLIANTPISTFIRRLEQTQVDLSDNAQFSLPFLPDEIQASQSTPSPSRRHKSQHPSPTPHSLSQEEASDQLIGDLMHYTQAPSSPYHLDPDPSIDSKTTNTGSSRPESPTTTNNNPLPPSQVSTVDVTQPSSQLNMPPTRHEPSSPFHPGSQKRKRRPIEDEEVIDLVSSSPSQRKTGGATQTHTREISSSPPAPASAHPINKTADRHEELSEPLQPHRRAILTATQLLPESLMDSLPRPPLIDFLSQESLLEEEEEL
ncbi:MAG: hypothetical protein M1834_008368 [Cirrosporium novae-zelandiae]|nr:MAG: hypothetical protein M1834_008368 [Cirrosporium novae-zelandiae]